ncbi:MAG: gamma-glutamyltransferase [Sulfobacillus acidophilus]|uniref:Gamma-glutamyltransferase n=1 Tax=Sulfobacillus acidophilus TaxID=53633 RepID=A0A2T2WH30_9FIRM|nr:MAG: gamma-glutamyltransferase [Sulfobacillus acidophilus]
MKAWPRPFWSLNGAVATPNALASGAALRILAQGGNAVEAAIAAAATMAVVYPHMNGIGGDNVWLIHDGRKSETRALLGIGRAGQGVSIDAYVARGISGTLPARGVLAANTAPGAIDGWWEAYQYSVSQLDGRLDWPELLAAAISYADEGYPVTESQATWSMLLPELAEQYSLPGLRETYLTKAGQPPRVGERQRVSGLAETLREVAKAGRDGFYRGLVAESIIEEIQAAGGLLEYDDWTRPHATWDTPLSLPYRGRYQLINTPAPTQGFSALMLLGLVEHFPLPTWDRQSARYIHVMIESAKLALNCRNQELGDPDYMHYPAQQLLSPANLRAAARHIDADGAALDIPLDRPWDGGTVAIMTADRMGNAVSLIQSIYHDFGSGFIAQRSGVLLQNRGTSFRLEKDTPNSLMPGKRPAHTLCAAMVMREQRPLLVYGTMGGDGQPQTQSAVATGVLDYGLNVQEALSAPRWLYGRTWGETQAAVVLENRFSDAVLQDLRRRGHQVSVVSSYDDKLGHAQAIMIDAVTSAMAAATDPRSDGGAYSW